jgi:hypothetical protein
MFIYLVFTDIPVKGYFKNDLLVGFIKNDLGCRISCCFGLTNGLKTYSRTISTPDLVNPYI